MGLISYYGKMFQVSYVAKDLDRAVEFLGKKLGATDFTIFTSEITALFGTEQRDLSMRVAIINVENHQFEVIQPVSGAIDLYVDGIDYDHSILTFHHVGLAVRGPYSEWEKLEAEIRASGDQFAIVCPPDPGPKPTVRFGYVDTRPYFGHFTEYLWWSDDMPPGNPAFPDLSR